jgi:hypothetical protein
LVVDGAARWYPIARAVFSQTNLPAEGELPELAALAIRLNVALPFR